MYMPSLISAELGLRKINGSSGTSFPISLAWST
jgi:hypothetical protein